MSHQFLTDDHDHISWTNTTDGKPKSYTCGYCAHQVGPVKCFRGTLYRKNTKGGLQSTETAVYICSYCNMPTFFPDIQSNLQTPSPMPGTPIKHIPSAINNAYQEARLCFQAGSFTASVLMCRKLLMNMAVTNGAEINLSFASYVDFLASNGYLPPNAKPWVDRIRLLGNEATHDVTAKSSTDATLALKVTEMLLRFLYEYPEEAKSIS